MKRKIIALVLILAIVLSFGLVACGDKPEPKVGVGTDFTVRPNMSSPNQYQIQGIYGKNQDGTFTRNDSKSAALNNIVTTTAKVTLNGDKIKTVEVDALELCHPFYDGPSMPHYLEFGLYYVVQISGKTVGSNGTAASTTEMHDHAYMVDGEGMTTEEKTAITEAINAKIDALTYTEGKPTRADFKAFKATSAVCEKFEEQWKTKRERGDNYGMNANNDWHKQMDFFQTQMVGKTKAEIITWHETFFNVTGNGRVKAADATNAELTAIRAGATMALVDSHGNILAAIFKAMANAK